MSLELETEPRDKQQIDYDTLYLRDTAEKVLTEPRTPILLNPQEFPIAGLWGFEYQEREVLLQEILPREQKPVLIFDLDDTIWEHVRLLIQAINNAFPQTAVSLEYFARFGHTRKIPEWQENRTIMALHDEIVAGNHPKYFPFVNRASLEAVKTVAAVRQMGHLYCYLTGRKAGLFEVTKAALELNGLAYDPQMQLVNALDHPLPSDSQLYCAYADLTKVNEYKLAVVQQWLDNLRQTGWRGRMVIVDDLLKPFKALVETGTVEGISLTGPLNRNFPPYIREQRVHSWEKIGQILMALHSQVLTDDSSPYRAFECQSSFPGELLVVKKTDVGVGKFTLNPDEITSMLVPRQQWFDNHHPTPQGEIIF